MLSNLSQEYKEKLKEIRDHFGYASQKTKLLEELKELDVELKKLNAKNMDWEKLIDPNTDVYDLLSEMADCYVVAYQFEFSGFIEIILTAKFILAFENGYELYNGLSVLRSKEIIKIAKFKIDRTLKRYDIKY